MLLSAAYGDSKGFGAVLVGHYEEGLLKFDKTRWFEMPGQLDDAEKFIKANAASDLYFTPTLYSDAKKRQAEFATVSNVVYMDADSCAPDKFRVRPTISVETSPGRWQVYWLLDQEHTAQEVSDLSHRIAAAHKDDGCDPSSWILTKILRVPGSQHRKTEKHYDVTMRENTGEMFTYKELSAAYKDVSLPKAVSVTKTPMPDPASAPSAGDIVSNLPDHLTQLYINGPMDMNKRSEARMRFQIDLFQAGFTPEWVFFACQRANNLEKFTGESRPEQLWNEVLKSQQFAREDDTGAESTDKDGVVVSSPLSVPLALEFITVAERKWIVDNPGFVEEYIEWVKGRSPLSATTYQRSLAYMLLSCVYGDWAYATPQFGRMKLNLWAIIAGDTTATRKSTARGLMRSVLKQWQKVTGDKIDIGSDFTPQALVKTLGERDGKVSFIHRDEFQGFIHEIYTQNYMSGAEGRMTQLYDGEVMAVLRNTKELATEKEAETVFNFLAMGITDQIAGRLTTANIQSGFLTRFVWSVAEPPEWLPEHEQVGQMSAEDDLTGAQDDPTVAGFITQFRLAQRAWGMRSGEKRAIRFTPAALARWNAWKVDTKRYIAGMDNESVIEPSRDRLSYSVWKTAALIAIHDRKREINEEHLLRALEQAEWWFRDMVHMANQVASSEFESRVDKIEMLVATEDGRIPMKNVYKAFKDLHKGEVDEYINSLEAQGRCARRVHNNIKVLEATAHE